MTDKEQIEAAIATFIDAYNAGDVHGLMACYDPSLIKLRQGAAAESRDETESRLRQVVARFSGRLRVRNDELLISGDLAVVRGELWVELTPRSGDGPVERLQRRFLEVWRKADSTWRVVRTMDNSG